MREIDIVIPVYNEVLVLENLKKELEPIISKSEEFKFKLLFIDDGSTDGTLIKLIQWQEKNQSIEIIEFSRNFGKEAAITAGLNHSKGDACILFDADLQDPVDLIPKLSHEWKNSNVDIILARRINRTTESFYRRFFASVFYKILNHFSRHYTPTNVGDTRLLSAKVVKSVLLLNEKNRYMKGLMSWVGYEYRFVNYARQKRAAGTSKFNFWKLWNFALEGIFSNSSFPARVWLYLGSMCFLLALILASFIFFDVLINGVSVPGYASLAILISVFGGIQLISIGVLGEYIGRIFIEAQARPTFIIRKIHTVKK